MSRLDATTWEARHPLNGNRCPVTGAFPIVEPAWTVSRPDYRLRTGVLEPGVILSLPVGHTTMADTERFFTNLNAICNSGCVDTDRFVLVEDYTLHTGSDYEGRVSYIERMIHEIRPGAVIFVTRSYYWRLNVRLGMALGRWALNVRIADTYEKALTDASEVLGRSLLCRDSGFPPEATDLPSGTHWDAPRESVFIPSAAPIADERIAYTLKLLSRIQWDEFGFQVDPKAGLDPEYAALMLAMGSLKCDVDDFLATREEEITDLEAIVERAADLSRQIEEELSQAKSAQCLAEELAVMNQKLSVEISMSQMEVFLVLADNVDIRSGVQRGYTRKVAQRVQMLALKTGCDAELARRMHAAALLHHIGFLGIPDHADWRNPEHCRVGREVLGRIQGEVAQLAQDMAASHHEHYDGTGFPSGLRGDSIPLAARMLSVASWMVNSGDIPQDMAGREFDPELAVSVGAMTEDSGHTVE